MRRCHCGTSLEGRDPRAETCSARCRKAAWVSTAGDDEPCDPRELGPATAPGDSRAERAERLARRVLRLVEVDWTAAEIGAELGMHPDSVTRVARAAPTKLRAAR